MDLSLRHPGRDAHQQGGPAGGVTGYTYDGAGNPTATTQPDGSTTTYTYDRAGNKTSTTDSLGHKTSYIYNGFGQVLSMTEPQGGTTSYTYDAAGNLTSITDPTGATTSYTYDSAGRGIKLSTAAGDTIYSYDAAGNLASLTPPTGATMSYTYDDAGNMTSETDASGAVTKYDYNAENLLVKTTDPQGNITTYTYDLKGNKTSQTDANGRTTLYDYNFLGQTVKKTDPLGEITLYTYGGTGCPSCGGGSDKLTSLIDANGNATSYQYDTLGRLVSETDPVGNSTTYAYDGNGHLSAKTDGNGATTKYLYDSLGRLLKKTYPDATTMTFTYNANGNIQSASNADASYSFTYDAKGEIVTVTDRNGKQIAYSYDSLGNRTKTMGPDGRTITYNYDAGGRLTVMVDGGTFAIDYDSLGRRSRLTYPNGDTTTYAYDKNGRVTNLVHKNSKRAVIAGNSYVLDKAGNRLGNTTPDRSIAYDYDLVYRLTEALSSTPGFSANSSSNGQGTAIATQQQKEYYTYDSVGNRLSSDKIKVFVYNQGNQLVVNGGTYTYDKNGNLIQRITSDGTTTYAWNYDNQLIRVSTPDGTVDEFAYDPFGKRILKKVTKNGASTTTRYFYDSDDILFEYDEGGNIGNRYTHGLSTDEHLMVDTGKDRYYYHADGLSSIVALTDAAGNVSQAYDYDSFGNLKDRKNRVKQPYAYTGREWDKETGLYYYRARYYDPLEGRFISKDPKSFAGGDVNLYGYVKQNPINDTDPSGLSPQSQREKCKGEADAVYDKCVAAINNVSDGKTAHCIIEGIGAGILAGKRYSPVVGIVTGTIITCGCFAPDPFGIVFEASKFACEQKRQEIFSACMTE